MSEPNWFAVEIIGNSKTHKYVCSSCGLELGACYKIAQREPKGCDKPQKRKIFEGEEEVNTSGLILE